MIAMPDRIDTSRVRLDHINSEAVCRGIGERMRDVFDRDTDDVSQRLRAAINRLPELDRAPSIVPTAGAFADTR
jgi:hypothetical protein